VKTSAPVLRPSADADPRPEGRWRRCGSHRRRRVRRDRRRGRPPTWAASGRPAAPLRLGLRRRSGGTAVETGRRREGGRGRRAGRRPLRLGLRRRSGGTAVEIGRRREGGLGRRAGRRPLRLGRRGPSGGTAVETGRRREGGRGRRAGRRPLRLGLRRRSGGTAAAAPVVGDVAAGPPSGPDCRRGPRPEDRRRRCGSVAGGAPEKDRRRDRLPTRAASGRTVAPLRLPSPAARPKRPASIPAAEVAAFERPAAPLRLCRRRRRIGPAAQSYRDKIIRISNSENSSLEAFRSESRIVKLRDSKDRIERVALGEPTPT
jgi:hypothetical protein